MTNNDCPMYSSSVNAGFPSPAADFEENALNLHSLVVQNPASTFFIRAKGDSMIEAGILSDDLLVVDRSRKPRSGDIIIASLEGEMVVKRLLVKGSTILLVSENSKYLPLSIGPDREFATWGVVTHIVRRL